MSLVQNSISGEYADQIRKLNTLVDVTRILTSCRSTASVINKVLTSAMVAFESADAGIFYLYEDASGTLKVQTSFGMSDDSFAPQLRPGEGMSGYVFTSGQAALYNDDKQLTHLVNGQPHSNGKGPMLVNAYSMPKSALAAPLKLMGQSIGVIVLNSFSRDDAFVPSDLSLLQSLADQAAIAIDNVRLYERQSQLVQQLEQAIYETEIRGKRDLIDDLLSGKGNIDFERSAKALSIEPNAQSICLWMDLDRFEDYLHTQHDHELGETAVQRVKQQLYQTLSQIVRLQAPGSFVSLKSDEFVVFLRLPALTQDHSASRDLARQISESFQRELQQLHPGLTVSIGIGPAVRGLESLITTLHDVQRMVSLHQQNQQYGRIFFTEDLGVDRLLLQFGNSQALEEFARSMLGLLLYDGAPGNHDLLETLAAFFANHRNIADTARATHLHPNTVRYRLDRAKELLGSEDWLGVELAVRICRLFGHS